MLVDSREKLIALLAKKRVGLLVFNKDTRHFLRFYNAKLRIADYQVDYLIDPTLEYRSRIRALAEEVFPKQGIVTTIQGLRHVLDNGLIDVLICFDRQRDTYKAVNSLEDCHRVLRQDYDEYRQVTGTAEYNFRWRAQVVDHLTLYAAAKGARIVNAYWEDLCPDECQDASGRDLPGEVIERFVRFDRQGFGAMPTLEAGLEDARVRFILGTDWGAGKMAFLYNRMRDGCFGIAFDLWFSLVSDAFVPVVSAHESANVKGLMAGEIHRKWRDDPKREIYIKLGGRLEEYVYGIPVDRRLLVDNLHGYFQQIRFVVVLKANQTVADCRGVLAKFVSRYGIGDNLDVYQMSYDGAEKQVTFSGGNGIR